MYRSIAFALLLVVVAFPVSLEAQKRRVPKDAPLEERDPELATWVDTLIIKLQGENVRIRNSAAQALISIGADAAPKLTALRESGDRKTRRLATRILQRIGRESGRNMFKADPGGSAPDSLAKDIANVLKLDQGKAKMLEGTLKRAQDQDREIRILEKKKEIGTAAARTRRDQAKKLTRTELMAFLDEKQTRYVMARLGWGSRLDLLESEGDDGNSEEIEKMKRKRDARRGDSGR